MTVTPSKPTGPAPQTVPAQTTTGPAITTLGDLAPSNTNRVPEKADPPAKSTTLTLQSGTKVAAEPELVDVLKKQAFSGAKK